MLNVLQIDWPILLVRCAFLWSLLSSKFAWWLSGVVSKCWWLRILVVIAVWIAIILLRIVLFVRLLFKGLMPWNQVHAWYVFTRLVECYVDYKKDTLVGVVLAVLIQVDTKRGADNIDFTADEDYKKIIKQAFTESAENGAILLVTGSFYLVAEVKNMMLLH